MDNIARQNWLAERQKGIGGSDISGIIGISKYSTPLNVWESKVKPIKEIENVHTLAGKKLEQFVADWFDDEMEKLGVDFRVSKPEKEIYTDEFYPYFKASIDRELTDGESFEAKSTILNINEPLPEWIAQCQWYMGITNKQRWKICWVKLPWNFNYADFLSREWTREELLSLRLACSIQAETIFRNDEYIKVLRDEAHKFWHLYVLTNEPPPMRTAEDAMLLYPFHESGKYVSANLELSLKVQELRDLKEKIKDYEEQKEEIEIELKKIFEDSEAIVYNGTTLATYKTSEVTRIDTKALKANYPDIATECSKTAPERKLLIKKF